MSHETMECVKIEWNAIVLHLQYLKYLALKSKLKSIEHGDYIICLYLQ